MANKEAYYAKEPNLVLAKKLKWVIWPLCIVVFALVGMMRSETKLDLGIDFTFLPAIHAILNTGVAVCLVTALFAVKFDRVCLHRALMNLAMVLSILFLLCYVTYHFTTPETLYGDGDKNGIVSEIEKMQVLSARPIYLAILLTHIAAAAISLPLILFTWLYGFTNQFKKHKLFARITYPMWLYVAVTGPICYLMLKQFY